MGVDEEGTHLRLAEYLKDVIEPKIAEYGGRLIRSAGDGFLIEFDSATAAVGCGLAIQRELTDREARAPSVGARVERRAGGPRRKAGGNPPRQRRDRRPVALRFTRPTTCVSADLRVSAPFSLAITGFEGLDIAAEPARRIKPRRDAPPKTRE